MLSRTVLRSARAAPCRSFSSTAVASQAPIPPATKPASQSQPSLAPVPKTQLEQIRQYPAHPLLQFFRTQRFQITNKALGGPVAVEEQAGDAVSGSKSYVEMPQALLRSDLGKHGHSRSWLASELRLKSSADLHTLWYVLLMERNRLATAWEEVRRVGARPHARLFNQNLSQKNHRVSDTALANVAQLLTFAFARRTKSRWRASSSSSTSVVWPSSAPRSKYEAVCL